MIAMLWHKKSINNNNAAFITIEGNNYRIQFWFVTKSGAVVEIMKNVDLIKKKTTMIIEKLFIIVMSSIKP